VKTFSIIGGASVGISIPITGQSRKVLLSSQGLAFIQSNLDNAMTASHPMVAASLMEANMFALLRAQKVSSKEARLQSQSFSGSFKELSQEEWDTVRIKNAATRSQICGTPVKEVIVEKIVEVQVPTPVPPEEVIPPEVYVPPTTTF
jgi:hypothetical protein